MLPHIGIESSEQEKLLRQFDNAFSDQSIDFSTKISNLYKSQMATVEQYGRDGLALLLDHKTRVYEDGNKRSLEIMHYSDAPETCPWHGFKELPLKAAIREAWKAFPIALAGELESCCNDLFVLFEAGNWFLAYAYQANDFSDNTYYEFLGGREPNAAAQLPEELVKAGWKMPSDLQDFYKVHGNFGDLQSAIRDQNTHCIQSASTLELSLAFLEDREEAWETDYHFSELLTFFEDGAGNSRHFYKAMPAEGSYMTVDWDHETKEVSGAQTLADFINEQFTERLRG